MRTADTPHHVGAAVLFVIGMKNEKNIECVFENRIEVVLQLGHLVHHAQEIARIAQIKIWVNVRQAETVTVTICRNGGHFSEKSIGLELTGFDIIDITGIGIECRQRADRTDEHAHRMRVMMKSLHQFLRAFMQHCMMQDIVFPFVILCRCR